MWTDQIRSDRDAKIDALHTRLTTAVEALVTGDDWRRAMEFGARFRGRSFKNVLLIYSQHAEAYANGRVPEQWPTHVAGYRQWQSLGRQVTKGQPGYQIFAPVRARFASSTPSAADTWRRLARHEKPKPGETVQSKMVGVRPAYVWDVSQTHGDPIPDVPAPSLLTGQAPAGLWDGLANQVTDAGFDLRLVSDATSIAGANGLTDHLTRAVSVRMDMDDAARVKTLAHELTHATRHSPDNTDVPLHRGIAEVEAESVALMVLAAHGMDTSAYTVPYVATWADRVPGADPVEVIAGTAERVRTIANDILDKLETPKGPDGTPPGLEPRIAGNPSTPRPIEQRPTVEAVGL